MLRRRTSLSAVLSLLLLFSIIPMPAAARAAAGTAQIKSVRYAASGGVETLTVNVDGYGGVSAFSLWDPARFVVDVVGARTERGTLYVGEGSVTQVRFSQFDEDTARFVLDLSKAAAFTVKSGKGYIKAEAATGAPDVAPLVRVPSEPPQQADNARPTPADGLIALPAVSGTVDVTTDTSDVNNVPADVTTAGAVDVTTAAAVVTRTPRVTSDADGTPVGGVTTEVDGTPVGSTRTPRPLATPRRRPGAPQDGASAVTPGATASPAPSSAILKLNGGISIAKDSRMEFSMKGGGGTVTLNLPRGYSDRVTVRQLDEPPRLVLDIPLASASTLPETTTLLVNADVLRTVRLTRTGAEETRAEFDLRDMVACDVAREPGGLVIKLTNEFMPNVGYQNTGDRGFLTLYGAALTEGGETVTERYTAESANDGTRWEISFETALGAVGPGRADIGDALIDSVELFREGDRTRLVIVAKRRIQPVVFTKNDGNSGLLETTVSLLVPPARNQRVVVIDAGHGGHDPGAIALSGKPEKEFVLDIAQKVEARLSREENVYVFMTRDDDYFVDLYERAYLANKLGAALFVSIHANAVSGNPEAAGTETLYCPSGGRAGRFTSEQFARLTQDTLMSRLQTVNRGIMERPNLVVLRKTEMPAILVEAAFVTNEDDLAQLSRSVFRRSTANAIAESVEEALDIIG